MHVSCIYVCMYIYIYIYVCVCVSVCIYIYINYIKQKDIYKTLVYFDSLQILYSTTERLFEVAIEN